MKSSRLVWSLVAAAMLSAAPAAAQQDGAERDRWMLPYPRGVEVPTFTIEAEKARGVPGTSTSSPVAYGANWGTAYIGAGFQGRTRYAEYNRDGVDGAITAGFGIGNSYETVGLDVSVGLLGTVDNPGKLALGLKLHRALPGNAAVAVGVENALVSSAIDSDRSFYVVGSKQIDLAHPADAFSSVVVSGGLGNGRFLFEDDFQAGANGINVFGSVGVRVVESLGFIADWTGQDLALALSIVPFEDVPFTITPGFADVTGTAGDGARFVVGAAMGFYFPNFLAR